MKKVCTTLKPRVKEWKFTIYESPDAAYYLSMSRDKITGTDSTYSHEFSLKKDEIAVIEWLGTEYIYDDESTSKNGQPRSLQHEAYECIRMIKFPAADKDKISEVSPYVFVEAHYGWVSKGIISWSNSTPNKKTVNLTSIPTVDFSKIFKEPTNIDEGDKTISPSSIM